MIYGLGLIVSLVMGLAAAYLALHGGPWFLFLLTSVFFFSVSVGASKEEAEEDEPV